MKLADYKKTYEDFSSTTSDIVRKLAFAGIAIVWIYKQGTATSYQVPSELHWPTVLLVLCLFSDLLQFAVSTLIYFVYFRTKEVKGVDRNAEFKGPVGLTAPGWLLWGAKLVFVIWAYVLLILYLKGQLGI